jgi:hypothetical protein
MQASALAGGIVRITVSVPREDGEPGILRGRNASQREQSNHDRGAFQHKKSSSRLQPGIRRWKRERVWMQWLPKTLPGDAVLFEPIVEAEFLL